MKVLVANLGSTSFKFRLYDLDGEHQLARGAIDRIGGEGGVVSIEIGEQVIESTESVSDHAVAVGLCLDALTHPETGCLGSVEDVAAIGFKAVFAAGGEIDQLSQPIMMRQSENRLFLGKVVSFEYRRNTASNFLLREQVLFTIVDDNGSEDSDFVFMLLQHHDFGRGGSNINTDKLAFASKFRWQLHLAFSSTGHK